MDTPRAAQRNQRSQLAAGAALVVIGMVALALQYFEGPGRVLRLQKISLLLYFSIWWVIKLMRWKYMNCPMRLWIYS